MTSILARSSDGPEWRANAKLLTPSNTDSSEGHNKADQTHAADRTADPPHYCPITGASASLLTPDQKKCTSVHTMKKKPSLPPLTQRQQDVLEYLRKHIADQGCPPSSRDICREFGFSAPNAATGYLKALERKGYLTRQPGQARNIRLSHSLEGIPIVGEVAAGQPILAIENVTGSLDLTTAFGHGEVFAVRVKGDSMINCGILNGDYVVVRRQPDVLNGLIGVAYLNGEATVKRIYKTRRGYRLQPENKSYDPIEIEAPRDENEPPPDFRVAGPVVGVVRMVKQ
jgi:repressor LexA